MNGMKFICLIFLYKKKDLRISEGLKKSKLDVLPIFSPTVRKGEERLRICIHSFNKMSEVEALASKILSYQGGTFNQRVYL